MKLTRIHQMLHIGAIFFCSSCGDKSHSDGHRNYSVDQPSAGADRAKQKATEIDKPTALIPIDDKIKKRAAMISLSRANGDMITGLSLMHELMKEWSPIGLQKGTLIETLGKPTSASDKALIYRFDHGEGGWQWEFQIEKNIISKVYKVGLE